MNEQTQGWRSPLLRPVVLVLIVVMLWAVAGTPAAGAQSQNEFLLSVVADGQSFTGDDPLDSGTGITPTWTPGDDERGDNGVVRTYDFVRYRLDYNINEAAQTGVAISVTLGEHLEWRPPVSTGMFAGCSAGSSITTVNFLDDTLTCIVDQEDNEGNNGTILPIAQVTGALDGDPLTASATLMTNEDPVGLTSDADLTASAKPAGNFAKGDERLDGGGNVIGRKPELVEYDVDNRPGSGLPLPRRLRG